MLSQEGVVNKLIFAINLLQSVPLQTWVMIISCTRETDSLLESSTSYYQIRWLFFFALKIYTLPSPDLFFGRMTLWTVLPKLPSPLSPSCIWALGVTGRRSESRRRKITGYLFSIWPSSLALFLAIATFLYSLSSCWATATPWLQELVASPSIGEAHILNPAHIL